MAACKNSVAVGNARTVPFLHSGCSDKHKKNTQTKSLHIIGFTEEEVMRQTSISLDAKGSPR
ncbi:MAG: hypothetical protein DRI57_04375 [Deltaproteobacteria bacterium]|nr:MAG: hypothetical protein DRI57_04375 [Deltaproteobacteria bacterium]